MTLNEMDSVLRLVPETMKNNPQVVALQKSLDTDRKTADGNPMIDVTLPNVKGKMTSLSSLVKKNKLTIVDFWASWCGPCRAELPEMKKIYAEFKSKGVGMVGISFDSKKESWLKAIKTMGLDYQHISDLKGWESAAAKAYNVKAIPFTMLIDKKGVIVGRDLHGEALKARIAELLK
jgi:peroxiredoxin